MGSGWTRRRSRPRSTHDREAGDLPLLVVGTGGSVSTGAIDPLPELRRICDERSLWLHVDGAYGAFAALLPDAPPDLKALATADSVALDPHKWLYAPLEAGCALVRDAEALRDTFSYRPAYYHLAEDEGTNYFEYGPQNSRGFRALKVWLALRQVGREGYERMIADDCALARRLYELAEADPELEAWTHELSITTFRYVPRDLQDAGETAADISRRPQQGAARPLGARRRGVRLERDRPGQVPAARLRRQLPDERRGH